MIEVRGRKVLKEEAGYITALKALRHPRATESEDTFDERCRDA